MDDFIGFLLIFTFLIPVIPAVLAIILYVLLGGGSSSWNSGTHHSNSYSNTSCFGNNIGENGNSCDWQPCVDPDDREYDSFGSYGTEDDLAEWDENVDC